MPFKTRNFLFNHRSADVLTRIPFFANFAGSHVNTSHVAMTCAGWRVYMQVFLRVRGDTVWWPQTKGTAVNEWVHSFVDFCLIPLSTTCSLTYQPRICKDAFYPLSLMSLLYAICSTGCGSIIGRCFRACQRSSCAEERRPQ